VNLVDNQFGFNPLLGTRRQRLCFRLLARMGELEKLIAWYSR
jgi:lysine-N-methylase